VCECACVRMCVCFCGGSECVECVSVWLCENLCVCNLCVDVCVCYVCECV